MRLRVAVAVVWLELLWVELACDAVLVPVWVAVDADERVAVDVPVREVELPATATVPPVADDELFVLPWDRN